MKYYGISSHNREVVTVLIENSDQVLAEIEQKRKNRNWYLSVSGVTGKISANPCTPLFIYGATLCFLVIDQNNKVVYNDYEGSTFCNKLTSDLLAKVNF